MILNLISTKDKNGFGRLVADSFTKQGWEVHWWDYRRDAYPYECLDRDALTIVLRGEMIERIAPVLDWLRGSRFLWYAEDINKDQGLELMTLACYYDDIWVHWLSDPVRDSIGAKFTGKRLAEVPTLYADQSIWKPLHEDGPAMYEVLHYGCMTPRRERIMAELRRALPDVAICQMLEHDHVRLNRAVNRAKVALNLHAWSNMNLETRMAECMSACGFIISEPLPIANLNGWYVECEPMNIDQMASRIRHFTSTEMVHSDDLSRYNHLNIAKDISLLISDHGEVAGTDNSTDRGSAGKAADTETVAPVAG